MKQARCQGTLGLSVLRNVLFLHLTDGPMGVHFAPFCETEHVQEGQVALLCGWTSSLSAA